MTRPRRFLLPAVSSWSGFDFSPYLDTRTVTADRRKYIADQSRRRPRRQLEFGNPICPWASRQCFLHCGISHWYYDARRHGFYRIDQPRSNLDRGRQRPRCSVLVRFKHPLTQFARTIRDPNLRHWSISRSRVLGPSPDRLLLISSERTKNEVR